MRVFVTGATGFVGSAVVRELMLAGHQVLGLARSDSAARSLITVGVEAHRGDLQDLESLKSGVASADGVIHTAFIHDFSRFKEVCEIERHAIETLGSALEGSDRPFVITSGTALVTPGRIATEEDASILTPDDLPRVATEMVAVSLAKKGVRVSLVRLSPSVHGAGDHGFVKTLIQVARDKGVSAYVGDGANQWTAVHLLDAAHLYRLSLEKSVAGARYHAVDEQGIAFREIAEVIGKRLKVPVMSKSPEEADGHFGWFAPFAQLHCPASSNLTRQQLGWQATRPGLLAELESSDGYFAT